MTPWERLLRRYVPLIEGDLSRLDTLDGLTTHHHPTAAQRRGITEGATP